MARAIILILEGDAALRLSLREVLTRHDYAVLDTGSGAAAIALAAKHGPDLILLDMSLPKEDALAVAKRIHARMEAVPLVVALLAAKDRGRARRAEISQYCLGSMVKPIRLLHLPQDIARFLRLARRHTPPGATMADDYPKRRHPRFNLLLDARCRLQGGAAQMAGIIRTLSEGGLLLELPRKYSRGTRLEIGLHTADSRIHALGEVIWAGLTATAKKVKPVYRLGLRFVRLTELQRSALRRFLARRLPSKSAPPV